MQTSKKQQYMVITNNGEIISSCNTLFDIKKLNASEAPTLITTLQHLFPQVKKELKTKNVVYFKAVNHPASFLTGYYDLMFSLKQACDMPGFDPLYECWLTERTNHYDDVREYRQLNREAKIEHLTSK